VSSFPKTKRPASAKILDAWIRDRARAEGQIAQRIRLGIGYMVVSAVLARERHAVFERLTGKLPDCYCNLAKFAST
jgi:hypothetical protein